MAKAKKSKKKIVIFGILGLILIVVIALALTSGNTEQITSVQTEDVAKRTITQVVAATGKINPIEQVVLRPEVTGEIVSLPVEEGDVVKKGQLLIRIKPEQYIAQRNRSRASLESVKASLKVRKANMEQIASEYERTKGLYDKGLASETNLETALSSKLQAEGNYEAQKASVMQAEEALKEAEEQLGKTAIYSPMNGVVSALNVEMSERVLGSSFSQGTHLMTVANLNEMEARVNVDENDVVLISVGDTARIEIDAFGDKKFNALVYQIGNSAITSGLGSQDEVVNFEVRIKLLEIDAQIRPGMSCDSDIETDTRFDVVSVPIQSVTARMNKKKSGMGGNGGRPEGGAPKSVKNNKPKEVVFLVDGNKAKMVEVTTGISDDNYIEIKTGLSGDEQIVSGPYRAISKELEEGANVSVQGGKKKDKKTETEEEPANSEN